MVSLNTTPEQESKMCLNTISGVEGGFCTMSVSTVVSDSCSNIEPNVTPADFDKQVQEANGKCKP